MFLSSFKLTILGKSIYRSGSSVDVLESTAWIREVIIHYQKKKKIGNPCNIGTQVHTVDLGFMYMYKARV